jgi:hypothetical protein
MRPTLIIALLSALFVATHIGMASTRSRVWMVSRLGLGENWFVALWFVALYVYATVWMEVHQ